MSLVVKIKIIIIQNILNPLFLSVLHYFIYFFMLSTQVLLLYPKNVDEKYNLLSYSAWLDHVIYVWRLKQKYIFHTFFVFSFATIFYNYTSSNQSNIFLAEFCYVLLNYYNCSWTLLTYNCTLVLKFCVKKPL